MIIVAIIISFIIALPHTRIVVPAFVAATFVEVFLFFCFVFSSLPLLAASQYYFYSPKHRVRHYLPSVHDSVYTALFLFNTQYFGSQ